MRIADQYQTFPSMRLKWLLQIVKINNQFGFYISAFICQLHVVALIEHVIEETMDKKVKLNNFYQTIVQPMKTSKILEKYLLNSSIDFSFMPDVLCETKINIKHLIHDEFDKILLSDFNMDLLFNEIDNAISLGKKAFLFYSLRPLYSLEIRLYQSSRNYEKNSLLMKDFSQSVGKILTKTSNTIDIPILFYYVEYEKTKQIFAISKYQANNTQTDDILTILEKCDRFNGNKPCICEITVKDYLPHYRCSVDVLDIKNIEIPIKNYVSNIFKKSKSLLEQIASEFEIWFPMKSSDGKFKAMEEFFVKDIQRISDIILNTLSGNDSIGNLLLSFKETDESESLSMAKELRELLSRLLSVFNRAINEMNTKQPHQQMFAFCEAMSNDFLKKFNLEQVNSSPYIYLYDPMDDDIDF